MTTDTTMTDVDTTRPKTIYLCGPEEETLWSMNDLSDEEFPATAYIREDVHEALAAERDELERLVASVADDVCEQNCPQRWKTVEGQKHSEICKRVAAYQRKGE